MKRTPAKPKLQIVLLSGGIDSLVCAEMSRAAGTLAGCVFVDYGQPSSKVEQWNAGPYCLHRGIRLEVVHVHGLDLGDMGSGAGAHVMPRRNAVLMAFAANLAPSFGAEEVVIGANAADYAEYADCRQPFMRHMHDALGISVHAPLATWSKAQIIAKAVELGLSQGDSWSCYGPGPKPCDVCPSCVEATKAWAPAGEVWRTSCCGRTGRELEANGHATECGE